MAEVTLSQAAGRFAETLKGKDRASTLAEVNRFVRWYGAARGLGELRGHNVSLYTDVLGPATPESKRRGDQVRAFLIYLKKSGLLSENLGVHLRLRKASKTTAASSAAESTVELTQEGVDALEAELESLKGQRLEVREDIRRAMLDKDFRENAPLDAAKEKQGHIEARAREIEGMLKRAIVVKGAVGSGRVRVGCTVVVKNVASGALVRYMIVGPTEANAADGKISSVSPVGKALLDRTVGDEAEISVPAGALRLRVEEIAS
jgi:transcription elongation factor GreA